MALLSLFHMFILFSFLHFICSVYCSKYVPILMWDTVKNDDMIPALNHISKDDFEEIVADRLQDKNKIMVIFTEESLSTEDFMSYDIDGKNVFSRISEFRKTYHTDYYPFVESPIDVLKKVNRNVNRISYTQIKNMKVQAGQVVIIDLNDAKDNEDRVHMLVRHDNIIYTVFKKLITEHKDVMALYTGKHSSWLNPNEQEEENQNIRQRRDAVAENMPDSPSILFYASDKSTLQVEKNQYILDNCTNGDTFQLCNSTNAIVELTISVANSGYWFLNIFVTEQHGKYSLKNNVYAPIGFSYHCISSTFKGENNTVLTIPGFQVQPLFNNTLNVNKFSSAYDCVGFTSGPIWSGIFVTFILALIMTFGLCMIMDIKTMDRFDDPKGKTISINVSE